MGCGMHSVAWTFRLSGFQALRLSGSQPFRSCEVRLRGAANEAQHSTDGWMMKQKHGETEAEAEARSPASSTYLQKYSSRLTNSRPQTHLSRDSKGPPGASFASSSPAPSSPTPDSKKHPGAAIEQHIDQPNPPTYLPVHPPRPPHLHTTTHTHTHTHPHTSNLVFLPADHLHHGRLLRIRAQVRSLSGYGRHRLRHGFWMYA
jgi:hypothetical protein